jgi:putative flippase GtrA
VIERAYLEFERAIPEPVRTWLAPVFSSPASLRQFLAYALIGFAITVLDFSILAAMLHLGIYRPLSVSVAFLTAGTVQFLLNKYWNFRNFNRSISAQAGTYVALSAAFWIATVLWIELAVRVFGMSALLAKALFIPVNVVVGFLAVRHLAFGKGIRKTIADIIRAKRKP